jgi:hypothetical protein
MNHQINNEIRNYLVKNKDFAIQKLKNNLATLHPLIVEVFEDLNKLDLQAIQNQYLQELIDHCENNWTNPKNGYNQHISIQVMFFEYDYFYTNSPQADAYGSIGEGFRVEFQPYHYGYKHHFVSGIEASKGVTLTSFSPLAKIGDNIPVEYADEDFFNETDIISAYRFTTYLLFHDAIAEFVQTPSFKKLNCAPILHIHIGEHDMDSQPIYYIFNEDAHTV